MKRIAVIGCGGAGKSFFSRQLSEMLDVPVYHLDNMFWDSGWIEKPEDVYLQEQKNTIEKDKWIIDGNYMQTMELRFERADTIIYLDFSTYTCLLGIFSRYVKYKNNSRPDVPEGNKEKIDFEFFMFVLTFRTLRRPRILKLLGEYKSSTTQYRFTNRKQRKDFFGEVL